jgi:hypothetical protein
MAVSKGIGSLPQTRDLFTAPGSLLRYDPYFQDVQRFNKGGLGTGVSYESLQDPDPYGAERTVGQRERSLFGYAPWDDPRSLALGAAGTLMGAPLGVPALISGGIGAFQTLSEADKMRAGALPPGIADPLGFWDSLTAIFSKYEDAFTDEDMETLATYGLGGDLGVEAGGYNIADPKGTWADAPSGGPRVDTPLGRAQHAWAQMRAKELAQAAKYGESWTDPNPPPAWLGQPLPPDPITVEVLPEIYVSDDSATGGGGESYGFGAGADPDEGQEEGLGY